MTQPNKAGLHSWYSSYYNMCLTTRITARCTTSPIKVHPSQDKHQPDHETTAPDIEALAHYHHLHRCIHKFETQDLLSYRASFLDRQARGLIQPELYDKLLAGKLWRDTAYGSPAVLSFPELGRAKLALTGLEAVLQFVGSEGCCEGCTAANVRCKEVPRREGFCLQHLFQSGTCKAVDSGSKHRCERLQGADGHFCEHHGRYIWDLLTAGREALEEQMRKVAVAEVVLDGIYIPADLSIGDDDWIEAESLAEFLERQRQQEKGSLFDEEC